ncbi:MAG: IscS subfamily cysteine desulfurase [Planctomycetota bacterium]|nr:IscS subfamily cysteine desulfurase [Planctomycetota bacterium]MDA1113215.1 IscS subfamily cysteine desulfurase [Planctomycetota bacterium]
MSDTSQEKQVYLDYQATTPVDPKVLEAMLPYFQGTFGNPASRNHSFGWNAESAVDASRKSIAEAMGASAREIVFTSGATESNNLAILGVARMYKPKGKHIITCATEHKAILDPAQYLGKEGWEITILGVDANGHIDLDELRSAIREDTVLVSIMHGNNEIGTLHPIAEIGAICRAKGTLFHTDATQTLGKEEIHVQDMNIDLLSASAHKMYGPKGVGILYVRRRNPRVRLEPVQHGGGHERGARSGTLNVPGIVGFAKALELCLADREGEQKFVAGMRDRLQKRLTDALDHVHINGDENARLASNLNLSFAFVEGESMLMGMHGIAVSSGSACTSASLEPSYVLRALGVGDELAHSSIRFSVGRFTTEEEVDHAADLTIATVKKLREMSPLYEMAMEGIDLSTVQWSGH